MHRVGSTGVAGALQGAFVGVTLFGWGCTATAPQLPATNVLLIVIDCLRADHVGVYGHHRPTTPSLDALAEEGVVFRSAYSQAFWTRPSLPTILTGLYPSEHGLLELERNERGQVVGPALDPAVTTVAEELQAAGYATAMVGEQFHLSKRFRLDEGFDYYTNKSGRAGRITQRFLRWIDGVPDQSFFAYLHFLDIHWPYCPPSSTRGRFDPGTSDLRLCHNWRELRTAIRTHQIELDEADGQKMAARYDEELLDVDGHLGALFEQIKLRDRWDDLLVIVTADHGEEFLERGDVGHRSGLYDSLIHVPLIVKAPATWPGKTGIEVDRMTELRAVAPTIREAAGLAAGPGWGSLVPWIVEGHPPAERPDFVIAEAQESIALRSRASKLIVQRNGPERELYDLATDPGETRNLAAERNEEVARLEGFLEQWRARLAAANPVREVLDEETVEGLRALGYIE